MTVPQTQAPSFVVASYVHLTKGQEALLALMLQKIREKQPITRQEVIDLYQNHVMRKSNRVVEAEMDGKPSAKVVEKAPWEIQDSAMQWLRLNIGTLVLKGFLTAVPRFELDTQ